MNKLTTLACIGAISLLGACAAPTPRYLTLDDGRPRAAPSSPSPSVAIIRANVPELIDRPQLMVRSEANRVVFSGLYRWAEPLRLEIPRVIANDLAELLDSSRVAALPTDAAGFDVDFRLTLDFQRLEAVVGQGAEVDVLWRLEPRAGKAVVGRSTFRQQATGDASEETNGVPEMVTTQRAALRRVASEIAQTIAARQNP